MSELKKLIAVKGNSQTIGEFLEWLQGKGYVLSFWQDYGEEPHSWSELTPLRKSSEQLLAEYFDVNLDKVEQERKALLEKLRSRHE